MRFTKAIPAIMLAVAMVVAPAMADDIPDLDTVNDKASYFIGTQLGQQLSSEGLDDLNLEAFIFGVEQALQGEDLVLTDAELQEAMTEFSRIQMQRQMELAQQAEAEAQEFLAENRERDDVVETASGLQYRIIEPGTGDTPSAEDTVLAHYTGRLLDGQVFDSSHQRGEPATFPVHGVIPGWTEALQMMQEGATWELFIPADLAYGQQGRPGIPPNSLLIFEVELLQVQDEPPRQQMQLDDLSQEQLQQMLQQQ